MRRLIVAGLIFAGTLPAFAAHRISVAQLEQKLAADIAKHRSDEDIARQLADLELSERLTESTLQQLFTRLNPSPRTALAIELLADESSLLDPPRNELPATPPPDAAAQQRMLAAAHEYVDRTIPKLPNFFATRSTIRFDDTAQVLHAGQWPIRAGFHPVGTRSRTITFRDGREMSDTGKDQAEQSDQESGLYSFGEFGPILGRTLADVAKGKVSFSHWENSPLGIVAVFRYSVPRHNSHYQVHYCCFVEQVYHGQGDSLRGLSIAPPPRPGDPNPVKTQSFLPYDATPAYRGTLAIEPSTGAIARLTLDAELDPDQPITHASTVVEYGRVLIGDRTFICPVRSLALSSQPGPPLVEGEIIREPLLAINETSFTHYHRLGSSARLIADGSVPPAPPGRTAPPATTVPASDPPPTTPDPPAAVHPTVVAQPTNKSIAARNPDTTSPPPSAQPVALAASAPAPAPPAAPEFSIAPASELPDIPATPAAPRQDSSAPPDRSRIIDVYVTAFDRKGAPVTDLKQQDFEIYDAGQKEDIRSFAAPPPSADAPPPGDPATFVFTNHPPASAGNAGTPGTILLIDLTGLAPNDLNEVRNRILKSLDALPPSERVGLYVMTPAGFRVIAELTDGHAVAASQLKAFSPASQSVAPQESAGRLTVLSQVARHIALIPGKKNVVWITGEGLPHGVEPLVLRAQEDMNQAQASIDPVDAARSVSSDDASSLQQPDSEFPQASGAAPGAPSGFPANSGTPAPDVREPMDSKNAPRPSHEDHSFQSGMREIAAATGGQVIARASDLPKALARICRESASVYTLAFAPQAPPDGRYHPIEIKLAGRKGVTLRYRAGYVASADPSDLRDRFQLALSRPGDTPSIGLLATLVPGASNHSVRLSIAASDLALSKQDDRWTDKLDIFLAQRDDAGLGSQISGQTLSVRMLQSTYEKCLHDGIPFQHEIDLRPGIASVRIVVLDENSGRIGSLTIPAAPVRAAN